ncbi:hypothetical protein K474DRAFT_1675736 [Panus rudis PR-1116 ss-1]|nr:hypothetical protein K474DRAFT_1675736 [Panus rudis PR-1116 ss-1]
MATVQPKCQTVKRDIRAPGYVAEYMSARRTATLYHATWNEPGTTGLYSLQYCDAPLEAYNKVQNYSSSDVALYYRRRKRITELLLNRVRAILLHLAVSLDQVCAHYQTHNVQTRERSIEHARRDGQAQSCAKAADQVFGCLWSLLASASFDERRYLSPSSKILKSTEMTGELFLSSGAYNHIRGPHRHSQQFSPRLPNAFATKAELYAMATWRTLGTAWLLCADSSGYGTQWERFGKMRSILARSMSVLQHFATSRCAFNLVKKKGEEEWIVAMTPTSTPKDGRYLAKCEFQERRSPDYRREYQSVGISTTSTNTNLRLRWDPVDIVWSAALQLKFSRYRFAFAVLQESAQRTPLRAENPERAWNSHNVKLFCGNSA